MYGESKCFLFQFCSAFIQLSFNVCSTFVLIFFENSIISRVITESKRIIYPMQKKKRAIFCHYHGNFH